MTNAANEQRLQIKIFFIKILTAWNVHFHWKISLSQQRILDMPTNRIVKYVLTSKECNKSLNVTAYKRSRFKPHVRHQNENIKTNISSEVRKLFLRRFPLSRFLAKTLRKNKIAMKFKKKNCCSESTLNCRSRHLCIKLTLWETRSIILREGL